MEDIMAKKRTFICPCKKGKHELNLTNNPVWDYVAKTIDEHGELVKVKIIGEEKEYYIPRIFIAIHGLKATDLPLIFL